MAEKRRKRKRKGKSAAAGGAPVEHEGGGGGVLQSIRSGIQRAAGAEAEGKEPSKTSNILWTLALVAAGAFLLYRWFG